MDKSRRDQWLADWLEGDLPETHCDELLDKLRDDPGFRKSAARELLVKRLLDQERIPPGGFTAEVIETLRAESSESLTRGVITSLQKRRGRRHRLIWGSVCLAAVAIVVLLFLSVLAPNNDSPEIRIIAAEGVGTLDTDAFQSGKSIQLRRGILELDLAGKARVVIEAPASFRVISPLHLRLDQGRCFAEMRKGTSGLRIETPSGDAFDLGTSFAVEVSPSKSMEVHVFDGVVEVSDGTTTRQLTEGQGVVFKDSGELRSLAANSSRFVPRVPRTDLEKQPLLYWSFDEGTGDTVSATGRDPDLDLATGSFMPASPDSASPNWTSGVVGHALEFDGHSGWVGTRHPGISGSQDRTVACWVKLPNERRAPVSTIVGWGLGSRRFGLEKAWFLESAQASPGHPEYDGRLRLVAGNRTIGTTNLRDGRWHHVAAVAMAGRDGPTILLYVDGELEHANRDSAPTTLKTTTDHKLSEPIQFGRHLFADSQLLRGAIDEVYIYGEALSGDQIRQLMHP